MLFISSKTNWDIHDDGVSLSRKSQRELMDIAIKMTMTLLKTQMQKKSVNATFPLLAPKQ